MQERKYRQEEERKEEVERRKCTVREAQRQSERYQRLFFDARRTSHLRLDECESAYRHALIARDSEDEREHRHTTKTVYDALQEPL